MIVEGRGHKTPIVDVEGKGNHHIIIPKEHVYDHIKGIESY